MYASIRLSRVNSSVSDFHVQDLGGGESLRLLQEIASLFFADDVVLWLDLAVLIMRELCCKAKLLSN